jgi:hypothetical protein|tara:strand:- start:345 stop:1709 length:1365 start_codon:yes stop_codon:yes gene_type:complete
MPDIDQKNGIDMANIASINGQDIAASGGAFDPVAGTGTYTESVPTTGLIKIGGVSKSNPPDVYGIGDDIIGFANGTDTVRNIGSDVDGYYNVVKENLPAGMGTPTIVDFGPYSSWIIDSTGKLWRVGATLYGGTSANAGTESTNYEWRQVTGVGDSDTAWTDVSVGSTTTLLINSGKLYAIGANSNGNFGNGTTSNGYNAFTQVGIDTDWVSVHVDFYNSYAIKGSSNVLYATGRNANGKCGNSTTSGNQTTFTAVTATNLVSATNNNFTFVTSSRNNVLAIQSGRAFFWGDASSSFEAFGDNITGDQTIPVQSGKVSGTLQTDWSRGCVSDRYSLLINTSGELYHAGEGSYYVAMDGTQDAHKDGDHVQTGTDTDWQDVKVQKNYTFSTSGLARKNNQIIYTGFNTYGRIADSTQAYTTSPITVLQTVSSNDAWGVSSTSTNENTKFVFGYST